MKKLFAVLLITIAGAAAAQSQQQQRPANATVEKKSDKSDRDDAKKDPPRDNISTTSQSVRIGNETVNFTARAGTIVLKNDEGEPRASFFVVSYTRDGADPAKRPVTFTFNGGPGSSSVWLHMGAFGPKRVAYKDDEGHAGPPPYRLVDNSDSILDATDLVFIDPVTTGFSRAVPISEAKKFHGFEADIESVGELIRLWTTRNARWSSPKFLAGESYGTTRAAGLAGWLHGQGYYLNGIVLISSILNFGTARFNSGNDLPYELFLPTYTATAWYHKRLPADLQNMPLERVVAESEAFALGEYTAALMKGDRIGDTERRNVVDKLVRLTGLSREYIERTNLRIEISRFDKELLRERRRTVGRLDSRFIGIDRDAAGETNDDDPSYSAIYGEYTAVLNDYVRRTLKFETDLPYEILTGKVWPWSYERFQNQYVDVGETLRAAMTQNPYLRVMVANGYYDLATPFAATNYTFARMQIEPELRSNVTLHYYAGGHMMYIDRAAHKQLHDDVVSFIRASVPPVPQQ
ncbi:MAG TPA: peptidase S10 [Thermoanaerobaculia bacterium]|jgi:carboxypeptidase C (cathepsin A)